MKKDPRKNIPENDGIGEADLMTRRNFLVGLGKWSKAVVGGVLAASAFSVPEASANKKWTNRKGGKWNDRWHNRGSGKWKNRGGKWNDRWHNRGGGWHNRGGWNDHGWHNRGHKWSNGGIAWSNSRGGGGLWINF
ncbi:hypothetical protein DENIS_3041 [Desulfonema ishimotonii]|uniref:Uncharacterized protein n=1 Tax=Desulfonema ishimotonii TaxID=45657 RepID=A0A401FYN6_9BACT|nr:hypothetical protein [Desulfonema ishimotonii]GBC62078.1 hypothetical protein DENIS_3041 [Desulfonema ishimotonii]